MNSFVSTIFAVFFLGVGGGDGWFPVEKAPQVEEAQSEQDPSIWVLFSKKVEPEKILVRFPSAPSYKNTESGDLEIRADKEGEIYTLTVYKADFLDSFSSADQVYESEGKWIHKHIVKTKHHTYLFQTLAESRESPNHNLFISSFLVQ